MQQLFTIAQSSQLEIIFRVLMVLHRTQRTRDVHLLRITV